MRDANQPPLIAMTQDTALDYSPLVWLAVIGALFGTDLSKVTRIALGCLFVLQCIVIYWLLPHDARFLGGLHYGLLIIFASSATRDIQRLLASTRSVVATCAMLLLPWLGVQIYYARQFFPVSLGLEKTAFYGRYVAFYADYVELDRLLSKDTVLLVRDFRLSAAYAPRPIFFNPADLPLEKPVVLFAPPETIRSAGASLGGSTPGDPIYENAHAIRVTYRTPGIRPSIGSLQVVKFIRSRGNSD